MTEHYLPAYAGGKLQSARFQSISHCFYIYYSKVCDTHFHPTIFSRKVKHIHCIGHGKPCSHSKKIRGLINLIQTVAVHISGICSFLKN